MRASLTWHPHFEVWVLVAALALGRRWAVTRWAPPDAPRPSGRQAVAFGMGLLFLWMGADWPVHELAEAYLLSVHMFQHLLFTLVFPPLLIVGTPVWLLRRLLRPVLPAVRVLAQPLLAGLIFNAVIVISHIPALVDAALRNEALHFGVHVVLVAAAVLMWLPVLSTVPEIRRLSDPGRMVYLFLQSVVPTVPASFLTFAEGTIYRYYADAPRISSLTAVQDQQLAGVMMKLGGGALLWGTIIVIFFRWYQAEGRPQAEGVLTWDQVERELARTAPPPEA